MKRWTLAGLLLLCAVVAAHAQSFKLYYANNVTDVRRIGYFPWADMFIIG